MFQDKLYKVNFWMILKVVVKSFNADYGKYSDVPSLL